MGTPRLIAADSDSGQILSTAVRTWLETTYGLRDTGYRQLSALTAPTNATVNSWKLRRVGALVELYYNFQNTSASTVNFTFPAATWLPVGFRPPEQRIFAHSQNGGNVTGTLAVGTNGVQPYSIVASATDQASISWMTNDAWPTTLPGTAV